MCLFCLVPSLGMINRSVIGCQIELKTAERGQGATDKLKSVGNPTDLSSRAKRESTSILTAGLSGHQNFLIGQVRRRRSLRDKRQPLQGQERPDHVLADALGLRLRLGPHPAVDREPRVAPSEQPLEMMEQHTIEQKSEKEDGDGKYTENWISAAIVGKENSLIAHLFHFKSIWTVI